MKYEKLLLWHKEYVWIALEMKCKILVENDNKLNVHTTWINWMCIPPEHYDAFVQPALIVAVSELLIPRPIVVSRSTFPLICKRWDLNSSSICFVHPTSDCNIPFLLAKIKLLFPFKRNTNPERFWSLSLWHWKHHQKIWDNLYSLAHIQQPELEHCLLSLEHCLSSFQNTLKTNHASRKLLEFLLELMPRQNHKSSPLSASQIRVWSPYSGSDSIVTLICVAHSC